MKSVKELPDIREVEENVQQMPNQGWPSSHISIVANLELTSSSPKSSQKLHFKKTKERENTRPSGKPCKYWIQGHCRYGETCKFQHAQQYFIRQEYDHNPLYFYPNYFLPQYPPNYVQNYLVPYPTYFYGVNPPYQHQGQLEQTNGQSETN